MFLSLLIPCHQSLLGVGACARTQDHVDIVDNLELFVISRVCRDWRVDMYNSQSVLRASH